jgi:Pyridoxamine 5'-phosphate oxidase
MLGLVYRIGAGILICDGSEADAGDKEQVDQQDGDEYKASDDDVKRTKAKDALFSVMREIRRRDVVFVVMVAVIEFGHGFKVLKGRRAQRKSILSRMTKAELFAFLSSCKLGVLGSISPEGVPQSALVGIAVTEEIEIIFDTLDTTRKYRNLTASCAASFAVGWEDERTVQFEGDAFLPEGDELARYKEIYFATWLDGPARQSWPGITYFVVRPRWIRYSDFDQRPPRIEELSF